MNLLLAQDGIFPITRNASGKETTGTPASGFNFPGTIQGEGKLAGVPSLFVRLAGCNLHCSWKGSDGSLQPCDTAYAAFQLSGEYRMPIAAIADTIQANLGSIRHLVITGGEPFLQAKGVGELCRILKTTLDIHITIETNATLFNEEVALHTDLFSLSPKLASSTPEAPYRDRHEQLRIQPEIIQQFISFARHHNKAFQLKFVYACEEDIPEIKSLLSQLHNWQNDDILLMPLGTTLPELSHTTPGALSHAIQNGWRFGDRLHVRLFGNKRGI